MGLKIKQNHGEKKIDMYLRIESVHIHYFPSIHQAKPNFEEGSCKIHIQYNVYDKKDGKIMSRWQHEGLYDLNSTENAIKFAYKELKNEVYKDATDA